MDFRKRLVEDFAIIFNGSDTNETEERVDTGFAEKWGYFGLMYRLCNGEIINLEIISKLSLLEAFTWLSYETDLNLNKQINLDGSKQ